MSRDGEVMRCARSRARPPFSSGGGSRRASAAARFHCTLYVGGRMIFGGPLLHCSGQGGAAGPCARHPTSHTTTNAACTINSTVLRGGEPSPLRGARNTIVCVHMSLWVDQAGVPSTQQLVDRHARRPHVTGTAYNTRDRSTAPRVSEPLLHSQPRVCCGTQLSDCNKTICVGTRSGSFHQKQGLALTQGDGQLPPHM